MSIRVHKKTRFTTISNDLINDSRLSWEARGLLIYLLSKPDGWKIRNSDLIKNSPAGRDKVAGIIKELGENQYLYRWADRIKGGRFEWKSEVFESPQEMAEWVQEQGGLPKSHNTKGLDHDGKTVNGQSAFDHNGKTVNGSTVNGGTVNGKGVDIVNLDLEKTDLEKTDPKKTEDPERAIAQKCVLVFEGEVLDQRPVKPEEPENGAEQKEDSALALRVSPERPRRAFNLLEGQLKRQNIVPSDYVRFREVYAGFCDQVSEYGFGSEVRVQQAWSNLIAAGWTGPDEDFWDGLEFFVEAKTQDWIDGGGVFLPGIPGGRVWLESQRWVRAAAAKRRSGSFAALGIRPQKKKTRSEKLEEGFAIQDRLVKEMAARIAREKELEECHDF